MSRQIVRCWGLWIVTAFLIATETMAGLPKSNDSWLRVDTKHFSVFGNIDKRRILEVARRIDQFNEVVQESTAGLSRMSPVPTFVFAFKSDASFTPYALGDDRKALAIAGYFLQGTDRNFITLDLSGDITPYPMVFHEYVHYVVHNNLSGAPLWLNEGLAEFYSTLSTESSEGIVRLGQPIPQHLGILRYGDLIPLDRLFAIDHKAPEYNEGERQGVFYAESWALVHWLIADDPSRRQRFNRFLGELRYGIDAKKAFLSRMELDPATIEKALAAYVRRTGLNYFKFDFGETLETTKYEVQPVSRSEVLARLGDLLAHRSRADFPDAEAHLQAALSLQADQPIARLAYCGLEVRRDRWEQAVVQCESALVQGGAAARTDYGWKILDLFLTYPRLDAGPAPARTEVAKARALFRDALAEEPANTRALAGFGHSFIAGDASSEGIAALREARRLLPRQPQFTLDLIWLTANAGQLDEALKLFDGDLQRESREGWILSNAEFALARGAALKAAVASATDHPDEARAILLSVLERVKGNATRKHLETALALIDSTVGSNSSPVD